MSDLIKSDKGTNPLLRHDCYKEYMASKQDEASSEQEEEEEEPKPPPPKKSKVLTNVSVGSQMLPDRKVFLDSLFKYGETCANFGALSLSDLDTLLPTGQVSSSSL